MRFDTILALAGGLSLSACALYFEQDPGTGGDPSPACELYTTNPAIPGYPFDFTYYEQVVWPLTQRSCGSSGGCHDGQDGFSSSFEVWPQDGDACSPIRSFNALFDHSDFIGSPANSLVLAALDGRIPTHPVQPGPGSQDYELLLDFIEEAWFRFGGVPSPSVYFDFDVYQGEIQPMLDDASCSAAGCHDVFSTFSPFTLYYRPARDSAEMYTNFDQVTRYVDLNVWPPEETRLYMESTNWHGGTAVADPVALVDWMGNAFDNVSLGGD